MRQRTQLRLLVRQYYVKSTGVCGKGERAQLYKALGEEILFLIRAAFYDYFESPLEGYMRWLFY
jgi:hypothetical protein